jgi:hypothetical protein
MVCRTAHICDRFGARVASGGSALRVTSRDYANGADAWLFTLSGSSNVHVQLARLKGVHTLQCFSYGLGGSRPLALDVDVVVDV